MKKFITRLFALALLGLLVATAFPASAFAVPAGPGSADFYGPSVFPWVLVGEVYYARDNKQVKDFFGEITKDLRPGDEKVFTVRLENKMSRTVEFFMRAGPVTHDPVTSLDGIVSEDLVTPGASFDDKDNLPNDSLLDFIWLKVTHPFSASAPPLYNGWMRGDGKGIYGPGWLSLGKVAANQVGRIEVTIIAPIELPNFFQNTLASVQWQFYALFDDSTPPPETEPPEEESVPPESVPVDLETPTPDGPTPTPDEIETIPPTQGPVGPPKDDDFIVVPVPPKTGDEADLWMWLALGGVALVALVAVILTGMKRKKDNK